MCVVHVQDEQRVVGENHLPHEVGQAGGRETGLPVPVALDEAVVVQFLEQLRLARPQVEKLLPVVLGVDVAVVPDEVFGGSLALVEFILLKFGKLDLFLCRA